MRTRIILIVAAVVMILGIGALLVRDRGPSVQLATSAVTTGAIARQVLSTGTLEPARMVEVGAQVSGTIAELPVDFNTMVKAGQIVARLDPSVYSSQLQAARAQLDQARAEAAQIKATLDDAKVKLGRAEELAAQQLITQAELDAARITTQQAEADLRGREASIRVAEAGVKQAQVDLERTVIRSPIDGIVVNRSVDVGQTIAASLQSPVLFTIADLRSMNLLTEVNEGEMSGVQPGAPVSFQIESLGSQTFHGTVATVRLQPYAEAAASTTATTGTTGTSVTAGTTGSTSNTGSTASTTTTVNASTASGAAASTATAPGAVTYTAVVDVKNDDGRLAPGGTAIVTMSGGSRQGVVRLPNTALSFRPSPQMLERTGQEGLTINSGSTTGDPNTRISQVWRFENNRFVPLDVRTGLSDDQWTEMISGAVQPGDQLITGAAAR